MDKLKIRTITQTCFACPSQWEGFLEDGRMIYIRYRWGCLDISVSDKPTFDVADAVDGPAVFYEQIGEGLDGCITLSEVLDIAPIVLLEDSIVPTAAHYDYASDALPDEEVIDEDQDWNPLPENPEEYGWSDEEEKP